MRDSQVLVLARAFLARFFESEATAGRTDLRESFFWLGHELIEALSVGPDAHSQYRRDRHQRMDFADACVVVLARRYERALVRTTDVRDVSTYRVPAASPEGAFHV